MAKIDKIKLEVTYRKTIFTSLDSFCHLIDKGSTIELTKWSNGEGYDIRCITYNGKTPTETMHSFTCGQLDALVRLYAFIEFNTSLQFNEE